MFKIDLNAKTRVSFTGFHLACKFDEKDTVEIILNNAEHFKLDLQAKDDAGRSGFQCAQKFGKTNIIDLIKRKMPSIAF